MNARKRSAECANHLRKTLAPLLLARERIEFNKIKGHEIVHPIELALIEKVLNETADYRFCSESPLLAQ